MTEPQKLLALKSRLQVCSWGITLFRKTRGHQIGNASASFYEVILIYSSMNEKGCLLEFEKIPFISAEGPRKVTVQT